MTGFGTHNGWLAFRGWLGAKIYCCDVSWTTIKKPHMKDYHVVKIGAKQ